MNIEIIPLISFVIVTTFTPGPNNISSASMGVMCGYRKTISYLIGITCGFFVVMLACAYLASTLLHVLPSAERYLRWLGACYILWLAYGILLSHQPASGSNDSVKAFAKGFMLQLFNPKVAVYGITIYSTFLASLSGRMDYLSLSALTLALTAFVATSVWALFGAAIKQKLEKESFSRMVNISLSILLIYTAVDLSGLI